MKKLLFRLAKEYPAFTFIEFSYIVTALINLLTGNIALGVQLFVVTLGIPIVLMEAIMKNTKRGNNDDQQLR